MIFLSTAAAAFVFFFPTLRLLMLLTGNWFDPKCWLCLTNKLEDLQDLWDACELSELSSPPTLTRIRALTHTHLASAHVAHANNTHGRSVALFCSFPRWTTGVCTEIASLPLFASLQLFQLFLFLLFLLLLLLLLWGRRCLTSSMKFEQHLLEISALVLYFPNLFYVFGELCGSLVMCSYVKRRAICRRTIFLLLIGFRFRCKLAKASVSMLLRIKENSLVLRWTTM